jgi:hypothetical protein
MICVIQEVNPVQKNETQRGRCCVYQASLEDAERERRLRAILMSDEKKERNAVHNARQYQGEPCFHSDDVL